MEPTSQLRNRLNHSPPMSQNALKFLFLFVVIGAIFFSHAVYPTFSIIPNLSADEAQSTISSSSNNSAPIVALQAPSTVSVSTTTSPSVAVAQSTGIGFVVGGSTASFTKVASTTPPSLPDAEALVADLASGTPMLSLNTNARWPMASLTKLMTAAIVFDRMDMNQTITITPQMFSVDPQEYTLQVGGTYTVSDLLRVLLLPSSNVAAEALADTYGYTQFMALMNAKAAQWGMVNTYYADPSGLSAANQSSANDLLLLAEQIYQNYPQILAITRVPHVMITNLTSGRKVAVDSIDLFSGEPDFIGGKTGHTDEASGNLLTIFNYDGHPLFVLALGTNDRFGDSTKLFDWAKANYR